MYKKHYTGLASLKSPRLSRFLINKNKGFTLIELLVTVILISLVITTFLLLVRPDQATKKAKDNKNLSLLYKIDEEIISFRLDFSRYPQVSELSSSLPGNITYGFTSTGYELNLVLFYFTDMMANDGGNNANVYEIGNQLTIL